MKLPIVETLIDRNDGLEIVKCIKIARFLKPLDKISPNLSLVWDLWCNDPTLTQDTGETFDTSVLSPAQQRELNLFLNLQNH